MNRTIKFRGLRKDKKGSYTEPASPWKFYPNEKPTKNGWYLCVGTLPFPDTYNWESGEWINPHPDYAIRAFMEIPELPEEETN